MNNSSNNALEPGSELPAFAKPLVGFASGEDELFSFLKTDIGPEFYWTPEESFLLAFPRLPAGHCATGTANNASTSKRLKKIKFTGPACPQKKISGI